MSRFGAHRVYVALGLALSAARETRADEPRWIAPESCPEPPSAFTESDASPPVGTAPTPQVRVVIVDRADRWSATVHARYEGGLQGARELGARDCAELTRAVLVALSLLEDGAPLADYPGDTGSETRALPASPEASSRLVPTALEPSLPRVTTGVDVAEIARPPVDAGTTKLDPSSEPSGLGLLLAPVLALEGAHFAELGGAITLVGWWYGWGARLQGAFRKPITSVSASHELVVDLQRASASLEACRRLGQARLDACTGLRIENLQGRADRLDDTGRSIWLPAFGGALAFGLPVGAGWAYTAEVQSHFRLRSASLTAEPWGSVYDLPRWDVVFLMGAGWVP